MDFISSSSLSIPGNSVREMHFLSKTLDLNRVHTEWKAKSQAKSPSVSDVHVQWRKMSKRFFAFAFAFVWCEITLTISINVLLSCVKFEALEHGYIDERAPEHEDH